MADETKNIVVKVKVEGDLGGLATIAKAGADIEKAKASIARADAQMAKFGVTTTRTSATLKTFGNSMQSANAISGRTTAAWQNIGAQVQDTAVQIEMGTDAMRVFGQQGPQAISALSGVFKEGSKLSAFFAGPWGAGIAVAAAVLIPLISKLTEGEKALQEFNAALSDSQDAHIDYIRASGEMDVALGKTNEMLIKAERLAVSKAERDLESANKTLNASMAELQAAENYNAANKLRFGGAMGGQVNPLRGALGLWNMITGQGDIVKEATDTAEAAKIVEEAAARTLRARTQLNSVLKGNTDNTKAHTAATKENTSEADKAAKAWDQTFKNLSNYIEELNQGNPDIARIQQTITKLNAALASQKLSAEGTAEANRQLAEANKDLIATQERIALQNDPFGQYILSTNEAVRRTQQLQRELDVVNVLLAGPLDSNMKKLLEGYKKQVTDQIDPEGKTARDRANLYAAGGEGGEDAGRLQAQIEEQEKVIANLEKMHVSTKQAEEDLAALNRQKDLLNATPLELQGLNLAVEGINQFADGMAAAIEGTKSFNDAFEDMAKMMVRELTKLIVKWVLFQAISGLMGGAGGKNADFLSGLKDNLFKVAKGAAFDQGKVLQFEKGAAFAHGQIQKFAAGGIVHSPTVFPMANGVGLMGEAGPEAVMPLKRGTDGKLGVQASPVNVNIYNQAPGVAVETETDPNGDLSIIVRAVEQSRAAISADIRRGGTAVSKAIESTYGTSRAR